jgi:hypothetical protein
MFFSPVLFTFKVGLLAVLVIRTLKIMLCPITNSNPGIVTVFAAVPADVGHTAIPDFVVSVNTAPSGTSEYMV